MLWNFLRAPGSLPIGELMRRAHSRWLTRAVATGRAYPRIPTRRVSEGGFASVTSRPEGRHWADAWWEAALDKVEPEED